MGVEHIFRTFKSAIDPIELPNSFTFPFYYTPHPLVELAAHELQQELVERNFDHNFGLQPHQSGLIIGKMFGVLVVRNLANQIGYLAAFSGKLANQNHHDGFVPPVFDMLSSDSYFQQEEAPINAINAKITALEEKPEFISAQHSFSLLKQEAEADLNRLKEIHSRNKLNRDQIRNNSSQLSDAEITTLNRQLAEQSIQDKLTFKNATKYWAYKQAEIQSKLDEFNLQIHTLKEERKQLSNALQNRLFSDYTFLNANLEEKSLLNIFQSEGKETPPAGAGECSAPKLLQFAFQHQLTPIAMGEFWWGASPKSEVRVHKQFYPACRSKCEPILGHMLRGLNVEPNPLQINPTVGKQFEIVFEDPHLLVINKPAEFLSVPGKLHSDSVYTRIKALYPEATGPLLVHRLDMSTSGLLLIAKRKEIHKKLQAQFLNRSVEKRYQAIVEGKPNDLEGEIKLPLRVDLDNRPQQLVCYDYGKPAHTRWKVIQNNHHSTLLELTPITGRTHQLRVHCAHPSGLNSPIQGDDLYGKKSDRLYLHAAYLKFIHPVSKKSIELNVDAEFKI